MLLSLEDALQVLHLDAGLNDELILALCQAIPDYIQLQTGLTYEEQEREPLTRVVAGFLLTLWYYSERVDEVALTRTINALMKALKLKACTKETQNA